MAYRSKCVKCVNEGVDRQAVLRWTLFNGNVSIIAPLCMEHGAPLTELVNIVDPHPMHPLTGNIPKQAPLRVPKARPLMGWVKPESD